VAKDGWERRHALHGVALVGQAVDDAGVSPSGPAQKSTSRDGRSLRAGLSCFAPSLGGPSLGPADFHPYRGRGNAPMAALPSLHLRP